MKKPSIFLLGILLVIILSCQSNKKLVGYWYIPKTMYNVRFYPNNTFEYSDYDSTANKPVKRGGTYKLEGSVVTLNFDDNTQQTLSFEKIKAGEKDYYLKKDNAYFMRDVKVNNAVPVDSSKKKM